MTPSLYGSVKSKTNKVLNDSLDYCKNALQSVSRSFSLTIPLVEESILAPIMVGYLEARILDTFEDDKGKRKIKIEDRIRSMNLIMEILEKPYDSESDEKAKEIAKTASYFVKNDHYRELCQNIDRVLTVHRSLDEETRESMVRWLHEMNDGMQKFLRQPVNSFDDLDEYCYYVAGTPSGFLTELIRTKSKKISSEQNEILTKNERDFGLFLQKVNIIRDFREDILQHEKIFWPRNLFDKHELRPVELLDKGNKSVAMVILDAMLDNATKHVKPVKDYLHAIPDEYSGYRTGAAINFSMGVATLNAVSGNPELFYGDAPVKITHAVRDEILKDPLGYV